MTLVRKSEFANLCNVSNARVSQWLSEGKVDGEAIVGTGQRAQINVEVAREQLKLRLATDERYGLNGLGTKLDGPTVPRRGSENPHLIEPWREPAGVKLRDELLDARLRDVAIAIIFVGGPIQMRRAASWPSC